MRSLNLRGRLKAGGLAAQEGQRGQSLLRFRAFPIPAGKAEAATLGVALASGGSGNQGIVASLVPYTVGRFYGVPSLVAL